MVNKMNTKPEIIKSKFDLTSTMDLKWSIKNLIKIAVKTSPKEKLDAIKTSTDRKLKTDKDEPK